MTSNAYIASDGEKLMKVGKANDLQKREKQIALPITFTVACLNKDAAFRVEHELRDFVIERGGIRHAATKDWFAFDPQIYKMLCEFAAEQDGFKAVPVKEETQADIDAEIAALRRRYIRLLETEMQRKLDAVLAEIAQLKSEIRRRQEENHILRLSRYLTIEKIEQDYGEQHPEFVNTLKEKDAELARRLKEKDTDIRRILLEKNATITSLLEKIVRERTEAYIHDIALLHEEIGALKAEIRFLQETYGP
jgi:hypothetical protein